MPICSRTSDERQQGRHGLRSATEGGWRAIGHGGIRQGRDLWSEQQARLCAQAGSTNSTSNIWPTRSKTWAKAKSANWQVGWLSCWLTSSNGEANPRTEVKAGARRSSSSASASRSRSRNAESQVGDAKSRLARRRVARCDRAGAEGNGPRGTRVAREQSLDDGSGGRSGFLAGVREFTGQLFFDYFVLFSDHLFATLYHSFMGLKSKICGSNSTGFKNHFVSPSHSSILPDLCNSKPSSDSVKWAFADSGVEML